MFPTSVKAATAICPPATKIPNHLDYQPQNFQLPQFSVHKQPTPQTVSVPRFVGKVKRDANRKEPPINVTLEQFTNLLPERWTSTPSTATLLHTIHSLGVRDPTSGTAEDFVSRVGRLENYLPGLFGEHSGFAHGSLWDSMHKLQSLLKTEPGVLVNQLISLKAALPSLDVSRIVIKCPEILEEDPVRVVENFEMLESVAGLETEVALEVALVSPSCLLGDQLLGVLRGVHQEHVFKETAADQGAWFSCVGILGTTAEEVISDYTAAYQKDADVRTMALQRLLALG